jgi:hypothetical protein
MGTIWKSLAIGGAFFWNWAVCCVPVVVVAYLAYEVDMLKVVLPGRI